MRTNAFRPRFISMPHLSPIPLPFLLVDTCLLKNSSHGSKSRTNCRAIPKQVGEAHSPSAMGRASRSQLDPQIIRCATHQTAGPTVGRAPDRAMVVLFFGTSDKRCCTDAKANKQTISND